MPENTSGYVEALMAERHGYKVHGRNGRVAAVDAELKRIGVEVETTQEAPSRSKGAAVSCPDCGDEFKNARGLAVHQRHAHDSDQ